MALKLSVIIPVMQVEMARQLIRQIGSNSFLPERIILIDNSSGGFVPESSVPITRIRDPNFPLKANESLNLGVNTVGETDLVSIFNDDIIINPFLFEKVVDVMSSHDRCAVVCPTTVSNPKLVEMSRREGTEVGEMQKYEGWAFTIRNSVLKQIPKIPDELKTFCGDSWYWYWTTRRMGFCWLKVKSCYIYHYVGTSVTEEGYRRWLRKEKEIFNRIIDNLEKERLV